MQLNPGQLSLNLLEARPRPELAVWERLSEEERRAAVALLAGTADTHLEHRAAADDRIVGYCAIEATFELLDREFRQESELADVDPDNRHLIRPERTRYPDHGAVASKHDNSVRAGPRGFAPVQSKT